MVSVVAGEVGDFPEGLVHDCVFEWHGGVRDGMWRDVVWVGIVECFCVCVISGCFVVWRGGAREREVIMGK